MADSNFSAGGLMAGDNMATIKVEPSTGTAPDTMLGATKLDGVQYCNRCMKVLPVANFMKGSVLRKSCGNCRERNRLRFAQQKAERTVARNSSPVLLEDVAKYVRAHVADARRTATPRRSRERCSDVGFQLLFKVAVAEQTGLRRASPRIIADAIARQIGEGDGYVWQPGASYVNADSAIAQTFHYRCSLRTDPAKRRTNSNCASQRSTPIWRFLDCYNCAGFVKVAVAADLTYAVISAEHRTLHRRPAEIAAAPTAIMSTQDIVAEQDVATLDDGNNKHHSTMTTRSDTITGMPSAVAVSASPFVQIPVLESMPEMLAPIASLPFSATASPVPGDEAMTPITAVMYTAATNLLTAAAIHSESSNFSWPSLTISSMPMSPQAPVMTPAVTPLASSRPLDTAKATLFVQQFMNNSAAAAAAVAAANMAHHRQQQQHYPGGDLTPPQEMPTSLAYPLPSYPFPIMATPSASASPPVEGASDAAEETYRLLQQIATLAEEQRSLDQRYILNALQQLHPSWLPN